MVEYFNKKAHLPGNVPIGRFNSAFSFTGSKQIDAVTTKSLAVDGYFVPLCKIQLSNSAFMLQENVKRAIPSFWDPSSLASFIENYGTHIFTFITIGGKDVIYVKKHSSSTLSTMEIKNYVQDIGDQRFSDTDRRTSGPVKFKDKVVDSGLLNSRGIYPQPSNAPYLTGKETSPQLKNCGTFWSFKSLELGHHRRTNLLVTKKRICLSLFAVQYDGPKALHQPREDMMTDLMYPLQGNTVPFWAVPLVAILLPVVIIAGIYFYRKDVYDLHHAILGLLFAVLITGVLTDAIKDVVFDAVMKNVLCTGDKKVIKQGHKSFPSGHTSWSFAGLSFLAWYLAGKIRVFDRKGHVAKLCLIFLPLLVASLVGVSRVDDYWHHWQDVFAGGLLGTTVTSICYLQFFPPPYDTDGWGPFVYFQSLADSQPAGVVQPSSSMNNYNNM